MEAPFSTKSHLILPLLETRHAQGPANVMPLLREAIVMMRMRDQWRTSGVECIAGLLQVNWGNWVRVACKFLPQRKDQ